MGNKLGYGVACCGPSLSRGFLECRPACGSWPVLWAYNGLTSHEAKHIINIIQVSYLEISPWFQPSCLFCTTPPFQWCAKTRNCLTLTLIGQFISNNAMCRFETESPYFPSGMNISRHILPWDVSLPEYCNTFVEHALLAQPYPY